MDDSIIGRRMHVTISLELKIPIHEPIWNNIMVQSLNNFLAGIIQSQITKQILKIMLGELTKIEWYNLSF